MFYKNVTCFVCKKKKSKWSKKYNISEVARHETTEVNCFKETSLQTHHTTRHKNTLVNIHLPANHIFTVEYTLHAVYAVFRSHACTEHNYPLHVDPFNFYSVALFVLFTITETLDLYRHCKFVGHCSFYL